MNYGLTAAIAGLIVGAKHVVASLAASAPILAGEPAFVKKGEEGIAYNALGANISFHGVVRGEHFPVPVVAGDTIPVITAGPVHVTVAEAVEAYAPAFITAASKFGAAGTAIKGRYLTSAAAGALAIIELDIN